MVRNANLELSDEDRVLKIQEYWRECDAGNAELRERKADNARFYCGGDGQWDPEDIEILDEQKAPHLTFNRVMVSVNLISGYQRKYRQQISVLPRKASVQAIADVRTELCKHAMDTSYGDYKMSEQFLMGLIVSEGWIGLDIDRQHDPVNGDLMVKQYSPFDVEADSEARAYDVNDQENGCKYVFVSDWMDEDELLARYPQVEKESLSRLGESEVLSGHRGEDYNNSRSVVASMFDDKSTSDRERYRVKHCWWRQYERRVIYINDSVVDPDTGQPYVKRLEPHQVSRGNKVARLLREQGASGGRVVSWVQPKLRLSVMLGEEELEYNDAPLGQINLFPFVRFCPYWIDGHQMGLIENQKDPQKEYNKRMSQALRHLNSSVNSGILNPKGSLTGIDLKNAEELGSTPGIILNYDASKGKPEFIYPKPLSPGHVQFADMSDKNIDRISGVNDEMKGYANAQGVQSGKAIEAKRDQGLILGEVVFDNFNLSQIMFYTLLMEIVVYQSPEGSGLYSDEEVRQIVSEAEVQVDDPALRDWRTGRYLVKVATSPNSQTIMQENFALMLEMADKVMIPPDVIVDMSPLPDTVKAKTKAYQQQMMQAQQAQAQQAQGAA